MPELSVYEQVQRKLIKTTKYSSPEVRFWMAVTKDGPILRGMKTRCWVWTKHRCVLGYGKFKDKGCVPWLAHRFSWRLVHGSLPDNLCICHHCDNPSCVNPDHLFLGTPKDNVKDMTVKGRRVDHRGEQHGRSVFIETDIVDIRKKSLQGMSYKKIAKLYGVSASAISHVVKRRVWKHVE